MTRGRGKADGFDVQIGERIRFYRERAGLSQEALGQKLFGLSFQQIQKYESGSNRVALAQCVRIANIFGVDPSALYAGLATSNVVPVKKQLSFDAQQVAERWESIDDRSIQKSLRDYVNAAADASALCRPAMKAMKAVAAE